MAKKLLIRMTAIATAMAMVVLGAGVALADTVTNTLDSSVDNEKEQVALFVGGSSSTVSLKVIAKEGDLDAGCNIDAGEKLVVDVDNDKPAVASVSPAQLTFTACEQNQQITVAPVSAGTANIDFSVNTLQTNSGGTYDLRPARFQAVVSTVSCTATSITTNPSAQSITYGSDATFAAVGAGSPAPTVQWQSGSAATAAWADIPGATSASLTLTKPAVAESGTDYRAVFTNTCNGTKTATTTPASLTVGRKPITVTADAKSKTYGESDPQLTFSAPAGSLVGTDAFTGALTREAGSNVGTYAIQQGTLTAGNNYDLAYTGANLTINKAQLSVNAADKSKTYGDSNPALTPTYSGFVNGDTAATTTISGDVSCSLASDAGPNAGTYTDSITCTPGTLSSNNYSFITGSKGTFTINKAPTTTTLTCNSGPFYYTGSAVEPCSGSVTGAGGLDQSVTPTYSNNVMVGTATVDASFAGGANHLPSSAAQQTFSISAWTLRGFHRPIDGSGIYNSVKGGHTVPLKFNVLVGSTELTETSAVRSFGVEKANCVSGAAIDAVEELATTGGTSLRYDTTGGQFVQNWKTPTGAGTCYKATMTTQDGTSISALFKITK